MVFRVNGVRVMSRPDAAVYTARRLEMLHIVEDTLHYLVQRPVVHSELSGWPFMVMFRRCFCQVIISAFSSTGSDSDLTIIIDVFFTFQRALQHDMPRRCFFSCVRESNAEFISRAGWVYHPVNSPINIPFDGIVVLPG